jgi:hypothetical protein
MRPAMTPSKIGRATRSFRARHPESSLTPPDSSPGGVPVMDSWRGIPRHRSLAFARFNPGDRDRHAHDRRIFTDTLMTDTNTPRQYSTDRRGRDGGAVP